MRVREGHPRRRQCLSRGSSRRIQRCRLAHRRPMPTDELLGWIHRPHDRAFFACPPPPRRLLLARLRLLVVAHPAPAVRALREMEERRKGRAHPRQLRRRRAHIPRDEPEVNVSHFFCMSARECTTMRSKRKGTSPKLRRVRGGVRDAVLGGIGGLLDAGRIEVRTRTVRNSICGIRKNSNASWRPSRSIQGLLSPITRASLNVPRKLQRLSSEKRTRWRP